MLPRSIWLPIVAMGLIAIGAFVFNEWSVRSISAGDRELAALTAMEVDLIAFHARLAEAEASSSRFLQTGDPSDFEAFESVRAILPRANAALRSQARDDAALLAQAIELEALRNQAVAGMRDLPRNDQLRSLMARLAAATQNLRGELELRVSALRIRTANDVQWSRFAVAALGLLTLISLVLAVRLLFKDFWRQEAARNEQSNERQRLEQVVLDRTAELARLTTYLQTVAEQEKAALARDLHDELGGLLTAAKMDLAWLQGRASAKDLDVRTKLNALSEAIDEAMNLKRRVVENLRPALQSYFEETCKAAGLQCHMDVPKDGEQVPQDQAIALFRVGQESLTNILRHARARRVEMSLESNTAGLHLRIGDDGIGIDPARLSGALYHGLVGMRHRIEALHGRFSIAANTPTGTLVDVTVPRAAA